MTTLFGPATSQSSRTRRSVRTDLGVETSVEAEAASLRRSATSTQLLRRPSLTTARIEASVPLWRLLEVHRATPPRLAASVVSFIGHSQFTFPRSPVVQGPSLPRPQRRPTPRMNVPKKRQWLRCRPLYFNRNNHGPRSGSAVGSASSHHEPEPRSCWGRPAACPYESSATNVG